DRVLVIRHMRLLCALAICVASQAVGWTQKPAFDVASIRRNQSGSDVSSNRLQPGGRLSMVNRSLENLIREVYGFQTFQVSGATEWMRNERWDIVAKADGDPSFEQILDMMKALLAERFKLVSHVEPREMPVFALVAAKADRRLGPQIKVSAASCP